MIEAKIVLDSINPAGKRLTTWLLTYPRFIHSEFLTHRIFSRNAASSRAIPSKKILQAVLNSPAMFEQVGRANKGMTADEIADRDLTELFLVDWQELSRRVVEFVEEWSPNIAKQVINRALEPWMHMTVLATATDHSNFFRLRAHPAAQPEFQVLAYRMLSEYVRSTPQKLEWGQWHLPGVNIDATDEIPIEQKLRFCVALACRASYSAFEEPLTYEDAARIHDKGVANGHWSPFEHAAQAISLDEPLKMNPAFQVYPWSNFDWPGQDGPSYWGQYRKTFPTECHRDYTYEQFADILLSRPSWVRV